MTERYEPPSDFLKALVAEDVPLSGSEFANANFQRLLELTRDDHAANRDWATFLLAQDDLDTPAVRDALLAAAEDENESVRAEAILGLAKRDKQLALPLLQKELSGNSVSMPLLEAATLVSHPSLAAVLRDFAQPSEHAFLDDLAEKALKACEAKT